jgi:hypothetical protein
MHEYRPYIHGKDGGLMGPGRPIAADNDEAAIEKAQGYVDGLDWLLPAAQVASRATGQSPRSLQRK